MPGQKIATCCYCGSRSVLSLSGTTQHELTCGSCGAPLRRMKRLRCEAVERPAAVPQHQRAGPARKTTGKPRKRNPLSRKLLRAVFEIVEDVLD